MTTKRKVAYAVGLALCVVGLRSCGPAARRFSISEHSPVQLPFQSWVSDIELSQFDYVTFTVKLNPAIARELLPGGKFVPLAKLPEWERLESDLIEICHPP